MYKILIVEDDKLLNEGITFALRKYGFNTVSAFSSEDAEKYNFIDIDLIILDINLPGKNGIELCTEIRKKGSIPIIFLTAKDAEMDVVEGFRCGGDDYITKPFSLLILKERINAILKRRSHAKSDNIYVCDNLMFDFDKMVFTKNDKKLSMTATEGKLLKLFTENKGRVLTRTDILSKVWDIDGEFVDENTLSVNIKRLRNKIEDDSSKPRFIKTVFGIGYIWSDEI